MRQQWALRTSAALLSTPDNICRESCKVDLIPFLNQVLVRLNQVLLLDPVGLPAFTTMVMATACWTSNSSVKRPQTSEEDHIKRCKQDLASPSEPIISIV